jgi:hypothetical protein
MCRPIPGIHAFGGFGNNRRRGWPAFAGHDAGSESRFSACAGARPDLGYISYVIAFVKNK